MSHPRVLVVDDCAESRLLMRMILEPRDYQVLEADDAMEALSLISTNPYDVIVLDIALAHLDGFTIAEETRAGDWGELNQHTYIVGVTGLYLGKRDLSKAATGMDAFITKPILVRDFSEMIDAAVGRMAS